MAGSLVNPSVTASPTKPANILDRSTATVEVAAEILAAGGLVAFPTETVYGLGADAANPDAVAKIYSVKGRPSSHPLIAHVGQRTDLGRLGRTVPNEAEKLASAFWPGPLTIVVERGAGIAAETTGGRDTVGLRMPDHPIAVDLLMAFARIGSGVIAAPSANRFGAVSPTTARHVIEDLGDEVDAVLDGGPCRVGVESTIVDVTGDQPVLLRPGGISTVELVAVVGGPVLDDRSGPVRAPGMMPSHYAPAADVVLIDQAEVGRLEPRPGDGLITVGAGGTAKAAARGFENDAAWALPPDAAGYAARLYATLRAADRRAVTRLFVVPPESGSLLDAVLDRLERAAAPRT